MLLRSVAVLRALLLSFVLTLSVALSAASARAQAPDDAADAADPGEGDAGAAAEDAAGAAGEDAAAAPAGEDAGAADAGPDAAAADGVAAGDDAHAADGAGAAHDDAHAADDAGAAASDDAHAAGESASGDKPASGHDEDAPPGDAPPQDEHAAPRGDHTFDELMPDAEDMKAIDEDGDGAVDPEEEPIAFAAGAFGPDYAARLKALIDKTRDKVIAKMVHKTTTKQGKAMGLIIWIMLGLTGAGLFLLLIPVFLKKKYPGRESLLRKGAVLATVAWVTTMLVFTGAMFVLRTAKNETAMLASPPLAVADAAFDAAKDQVDFLAEDAPIILEAPIAKLAAGQEEGMLEAVLDNVSQFRDDLSMFKALATFFKSLNWLFAAFGTILVVLAVVLFMLSQKQVLSDILRLPGRAAAGDPGSFGAVYREMQRRTMREVLALMVTIGALIVMAIVSGVLLYVAVHPAVSALFDYVVYNIYYILGAPGASKLTVYTSLFGVGLFLGFVILFVLLANAFFLGKLQKVLQQKFRHQLPAGTHKKFFLWGPIASLWVQALPILFIIIGGFVLEKIIDVDRGEEIPWGTLLLVGPLSMLVGLPIFVWLAQGFRALKFLRKYDHLAGSPEQKTPPSASEATVKAA